MEADILVDRRRLGRRVSIWRGLAFFFAVIALVTAIGLSSAGPTQIAGDHVARVEISGIITDNRKQQQLLERIAKNNRAKALILAIDSPGGTTTGAEALYGAIRKVAEEKPVVATLGTLAASGGYIAALGADHIVTRGNTIAGSIGVLFQWPDATELARKIGVELEQVKSSPLKASPQPLVETSEEARAIIADLVGDSHEWFLALVAERRDMDTARARAVGDGRVMTGRDAVAANLADAIGGETEARKWLTDTHEIAAGLNIRTYRVRQPYDGFSGADAIGGFVANIVRAATQGSIIDARLALDGLVSVWHPKNQEN